VAVGAVPWQQAQAVFEGHLAVGRALAWAAAHREERPLAWLQVYEFGQPGVSSAAELARVPPEAWVVSLFPWELLTHYLWLCPSLEGASVAAWSSFWATAAGRAEAGGFGHLDWRTDPLLRDVWVLDAGRVRAALEGPSVSVQAVAADSTAEPPYAPATMCGGPDRAADAPGWVSAATPGPHCVEVALGRRLVLRGAQVVQLPEQWGSRIAALTIEAADEPDSYRPVWTGDGLERLATIDAAWEPRSVIGLRLTVHRQVGASEAPVLLAGMAVLG
jgi:hypothetical protein